MLVIINSGNVSTITSFAGASLMSMDSQQNIYFSGSYFNFIATSIPSIFSFNTNNGKNGYDFFQINFF